jgi:hypothetical protein
MINRAFHNHLWPVGRFYELKPPDTILNILAVFPNGLEVAYGYEEAERYMANTTCNTSPGPLTKSTDLPCLIIDNLTQNAYRAAFDQERQRGVISTPRHPHQFPDGATC